jgi:hypothetical protein
VSAPPIGREALVPNRALQPLAFLIGTWRTTGTHRLMPDTIFHGRTAFDWHEGGAFLIMRSEIDEPAIPSAVAIIGSDDLNGRLSMSYFDERGLSRLYDIEAGEGCLTWRRENEKLSQTMTVTAQAGGDRLEARGRMSEQGGPWEDDLQLSYERIA